jgi:hypothetical protein
VGGRESPSMRTSVRFGQPSVEKSLGALPVVAAFGRCRWWRRSGVAGGGGVRALPVVAAFGRRLDIAATIDRLCPVRDVAIATHGEVIEALVANRLTSPAPLVHVEDWARSFAVAEVFGLDADTLNDDRDPTGPRCHRRASRDRGLDRGSSDHRVRDRRVACIGI